MAFTVNNENTASKDKPFPKLMISDGDTIAAFSYWRDVGRCLVIKCPLDPQQEGIIRTFTHKECWKDYNDPITLQNK